jgi:hypothetical protein
MSSIHGKNSLSFRRVKTEESSSSTSTIGQDIKFAHRATAGETSIDLTALVTPPEMPNFINLTGTELLTINLKANKNSLILVSSLNGTLVCDLAYEINTSKLITLKYAAAEGEIFTGQLRTTQATANVVDGETYTCTGTLIAGQTDIALGQGFNLNAYPTSQIGQVMLHIDGVQQFRNAENATAAPLADGNYEEVDAGGGITNVLRMNDTFGVDVSWAVTSTGLILNSNNNVTQQQIDSLAGQVDALIPTVAGLAGVPETNFQAGPNDVDLKAFADKLYQNSIDIASNDVDIATNVADIATNVADIATKAPLPTTAVTPLALFNGAYILIPHGLGQVPEYIMPSLVFVVAAGGWSLGDEVFRWVDGLTGFSDTVISISADATNIIVKCNNNTFAHYLKTTGANAAFFVSDVKVKVKFY